MSSFRFKLQTLLELRAKMELESARRLAEARTDAEQAQRAVEALEDARRAGVEDANRLGSGGTSAGELQRRAFVTAQIDDHLAAANDKSRAAETVVDGLSDEFSDAHARRRVLDKLKEKHKAVWHGQQEQRDRATMDAIALQRHANRSKGDD